jgi:hypothetical protein
MCLCDCCTCCSVAILCRPVIRSGPCIFSRSNVTASPLLANSPPTALTNTRKSSVRGQTLTIPWKHYGCRNQKMTPSSGRSSLVMGITTFALTNIVNDSHVDRLISRSTAQHVLSKSRNEWPCIRLPKMEPILFFLGLMQVQLTSLRSNPAAVRVRMDRQASVVNT